MSIFSRHISEKLAALIDGESREDARSVELHLSQCATCQAEYEQVKLGMAVMERLARVEAPAAIWESIEAGLETCASGEAYGVAVGLSRSGDCARVSDLLAYAARGGSSVGSGSARRGAACGGETCCGNRIDRVG